MVQEQSLLQCRVPTVQNYSTGECVEIITLSWNEARSWRCKISEVLIRYEKIEAM